MEIIHVVLGKANPNRMNGVNIVVNSLATEQSAQRHKVTVWGLTKYVAYDFPKRNYSTQLFEYNNNLTSVSFHLFKAIKQLNKQTIVHIHGGFIPIFFCLAFLLKLNGIKFIYTTHGAYNKVAIKRSGFKKKFYFNLFENKLIKWASALHFIGKSEMEILQEKNVSNKCSLIPNGLQASANSFKKINTHSNNIQFGFCGRLSIDEKGLDILFNAFSIYKNMHHQPGTLVIAGDGPDKQRLHEMAIALNIQNAVDFKGSIFGTDKIQLLQSFDAFIHTSRNEGMPTAVLEAASLQVPAIISKETNLGDFVLKSEAGYVLNNNNTNELVKILLLVAKNRQTPNWKTIQQNAASMVATHFQWQKIAEQHIHLYQKALAA